MGPRRYHLCTAGIIGAAAQTTAGIRGDGSLSSRISPEQDLIAVYRSSGVPHPSMGSTAAYGPAQKGPSRPRRVAISLMRATVAAAVVDLPLPGQPARPMTVLAGRRGR